MAGQIELEYERATSLLDGLTDVRFKLLALVPTLSGTAVGLLRAGESAVTLLAVGLLGLAATFGILVYELRRRGGGLGCAAICSGGGQGDAVILKVA